MERIETNATVDAQGYVHVHIGSPGKTVHLSIAVEQTVADGAKLAGVTRIPGVCGGRACVTGTRIAVWLLEALRRDGATDDYLLDQYPQLTPQLLNAVWQFVAQNIAEIDGDIVDQATDADEAARG